jgi:sigma-B regulation protein RsbU (phosphoserine phosphatase)
VGGDFYDFAYINPDTVGILIGDVSGKGVPAALSMAQLLAEFRLNAPGVSSPAELLGLLNRGLVERSLRGLFCTVAVIAIDLETGGLMGANAGHHPMLVISDTGVTTALDASGPPIGIIPEISWEDVTMTLSPGDTLLFYTDGIAEARASNDSADSGGEPVEYGLEGLERVARAYHDCTPRELIDAIIGDVHRFCSPLAPHDDCTMIALRYLGHG